MTTADWKAVGLNVDAQIMGATLLSELGGVPKLAMTLWWAEIDDVLLSRGNTFKAGFGTGQQSKNSWRTWLETGKGEDIPPQAAQDAYNAYQTFAVSSSAKERKAMVEIILGTNAENVWRIGTVMFPPLPVITKKNLKNVPVLGPVLYQGLLSQDMYLAGGIFLILSSLTVF